LCLRVMLFKLRPKAGKSTLSFGLKKVSEVSAIDVKAQVRIEITIVSRLVDGDGDLGSWYVFCFPERFRAGSFVEFGRQFNCVDVEFSIWRELVIVPIVVLVAFDPMSFYWSPEFFVEIADRVEEINVVRLFSRSMIFAADELNSVDSYFAVTSHLNLHLWRSPQKRASMVTSNSGPVKPPSLLLVELPISIGPSMGPDPKNSVTCLEVVSFQPKVLAVGRRLTSDAMVSLCFDRNAFHTSLSETFCS
jgi:hypothetical protein